MGGNVVHDFLRGCADQALVQLSAPEADDVRDYSVPAIGIKVCLIRLLTHEGEVRLVMTNSFDEETPTTRKNLLALHTAVRDSSSVPMGEPASDG